MLSSEQCGVRWRSDGDVRRQTRLRIVYRIVSWRRYISIHARNNNCCYIVEVVSVRRIPRNKLKEHSGLNTSPDSWGERQTGRDRISQLMRVLVHTARDEPGRGEEPRWYALKATGADSSIIPVRKFPT